MEIENLKKLIQYERKNFSLKEENSKYEIKNLQDRIKNEEESIRTSISRWTIGDKNSMLVDSEKEKDDQFLQNILFERESLKFELEKAKQEIKFLENNKKNDNEFFEQVSKLTLKALYSFNSINSIHNLKDPYSIYI